jgi:inner membrane protein
MQKQLLGKVLVVALVFLLLQVPLLMIHGLVVERGSRQQAVVEDLARGSYGRQVLAGPVLSLPYVEEYEDAVQDGRKVERRRIERAVRILPAVESAEGTASVETKSRGLFKARGLDWRGTLRREFGLSNAAPVERSRPDSRITWGKPTLSLLIADPRGLDAAPTLEWDRQPLPLARGSALPNAASGLHATLPDGTLPDGTLDTPRRIAYSIAIGIHGTDSLSLVPPAAESRIRLRSEWPHPSFGGQFLPLPSSTRSSGGGFDAQWAVSALASNGQQQILAGLDGKSRCESAACVDHVEARVIEPMDV